MIDSPVLQNSVIPTQLVEDIYGRVRAQEIVLKVFLTKLVRNTVFSPESKSKTNASVYMRAPVLISDIVFVETIIVQIHNEEEKHTTTFNLLRNDAALPIRQIIKQYMRHVYNSNAQEMLHTLDELSHRVLTELPNDALGFRYSEDMEKYIKRCKEKCDESTSGLLTKKKNSYSDLLSANGLTKIHTTHL